MSPSLVSTTTTFVRSFVRSSARVETRLVEGRGTRGEGVGPSSRGSLAPASRVAEEGSEARKRDDRRRMVERGFPLSLSLFLPYVSLVLSIPRGGGRVVASRRETALHRGEARRKGRGRKRGR